MLELDHFQRANLYVSIHIFFEKLATGDQPPPEVKNLLESLGVELPSFTDEELELASRYLSSLRASDVRLDLQQATRTHLRLYIKSFIENAGYIVLGPADSITSMTAFAARLAIEIYIDQMTDGKKYQKLERLLHRFVKTHLIPVLTNANPQNKPLSKTVQELAMLLDEDCDTLLKQLTSTGSAV
ncbi:MAG: hypothetical protein QXI97_05170 [Nitrososphaerota archaeon]